MWVKNGGKVKWVFLGGMDLGVFRGEEMCGDMEIYTCVGDWALRGFKTIVGEELVWKTML